MPSATSLRVCSRWARRACRLTHRRKAADAYGRRMQHRTQGQAVVEFCLVAMMFFTLLFAIFDFGMLLPEWRTQRCRSCPRVGAAAGSHCTHLGRAGRLDQQLWRDLMHSILSAISRHSGMARGAGTIRPVPAAN